jgi:acyl carrier protein
MSLLRADEVCRDLREFLVSQVLGGTAPLLDETPLADVGVDSFALMETVLFVERRYGIVIPVERLTREHVRTVRSLGLCVASLAAG